MASLPPAVVETVDLTTPPPSPRQSPQPQPSHLQQNAPPAIPPHPPIPPQPQCNPPITMTIHPPLPTIPPPPILLTPLTLPTHPTPLPPPLSIPHPPPNPLPQAPIPQPSPPPLTKPAPLPPRLCLRCNSPSPRWHTGPDGFQTLCHRCGPLYQARRIAVYYTASANVASVLQTPGAVPKAIAAFIYRNMSRSRDMTRPLLVALPEDGVLPVPELDARGRSAWQPLCVDAEMPKGDAVTGGVARDGGVAGVGRVGAPRVVGLPPVMGVPSVTGAQPVGGREGTPEWSDDDEDENDADVEAANGVPALGMGGLGGEIGGGGGDARVDVGESGGGRGAFAPPRRENVVSVEGRGGIGGNGGGGGVFELSFTANEDAVPGVKREVKKEVRREDGGGREGGGDGRQTAEGERQTVEGERRIGENEQQPLQGEQETVNGQQPLQGDQEAVNGQQGDEGEGVREAVYSEPVRVIRFGRASGATEEQQDAPAEAVQSGAENGEDGQQAAAVESEARKSAQELVQELQVERGEDDGEEGALKEQEGVEESGSRKRPRSALAEQGNEGDVDIGMEDVVDVEDGDHAKANGDQAQPNGDQEQPNDEVEVIDVDAFEEEAAVMSQFVSSGVDEGVDGEVLCVAGENVQVGKRAKMEGPEGSFGGGGQSGVEGGDVHVVAGLMQQATNQGQIVADVKPFVQDVKLSTVDFRMPNMQLQPFCTDIKYPSTQLTQITQVKPQAYPMEKSEDVKVTMDDGTIIRKRPRSPLSPNSQAIRQRLQNWNGQLSVVKESDDEAEVLEEVYAQLDQDPLFSVGEQSQGELVSVKAWYGDTVHRLAIGEEVSYIEFVAKLKALFQVEREFGVQYRDNEDDFVKVASDGDVKEMMVNVKRYGISPLRVRLMDRDV